MNGTGHLVEDFAAPTHLCPVDLRKVGILIHGADGASKLLLSLYFHCLVSSVEKEVSSGFWIWIFGAMG